MTIQEVKKYWNMGYISLLEAKQFSIEAGYNMAKLSGSWVWFKINK